MRWGATLLAFVVGLGTSNSGHAESNGSAVPGGDFEQGLGGWLQTSNGSQPPFVSLFSPPDGEGVWAAGCDLNPGEEASLERRVPITSGEFITNAPAPGIPGRKLEMGAWVWLESTAGAGEVWLEVSSHDGASSTLLCESQRWNVELAPKSRWLYIATAPVAQTDGRVPSGASELRYSLHTTASGLVVFDAVRVREFAHEEIRLLDSSFEAWLPSNGAWDLAGTVDVGPRTADETGYYGPGHALLTGLPDSALSQTVNIQTAVNQMPLVAAGQRVEAGSWLRFTSDAFLPANASPMTYVELSVYARDELSSLERLVARGTWHPVAAQSEHWVYLTTTPIQALELAETQLRLEIKRSLSGELAVDFVQLGERHAVDGNPRQRVGCNYVGRYRAPQFPSAITPSSAQGRWRNWHWQTPPACSTSFEGFYHSPDCETASDCQRSNGRRNLASSPLHSEHDLPLVGSYDSRDPEVIRYHLALAASAGIDHIIFDYQGHTIAEQEVAQGREPINETTWETLVEECAQPGVDMKLAAMYEPKVHFQGWVQGEPSKAAKLAGITADLVHLALSMAGERSALRHDDRLVVFVFRNKICDPSGTQCLEEADWWQIADAVEDQTGQSLFLVGDTKPDSGSALQGFTRWQLVHRDLLVHRNWSDVRDGIPTLPVPNLTRLVNHTRGLDKSVRHWQAQQDQERVAVLTVWPGFDDAGVGGWGQDNVQGEDGMPLCVRVADDFAGNFYTTTVACALEGESHWIQIATWNDWNEATRIEPAWHPNYISASQVGQGAPAAVQQQVFGRLRETRQWIEAFKGHSSGGAPFRSIANRYLQRAARQPNVPLYD